MHGSYIVRVPAPELRIPCPVPGGKQRGDIGPGASKGGTQGQGGSAGADLQV